MDSKTLIFVVFLGLAFIGLVALWVSGIDHMQKNHPDYKGNDFFSDKPNFNDSEETENKDE